MNLPRSAPPLKTFLNCYRVIATGVTRPSASTIANRTPPSSLLRRKHSDSAGGDGSRDGVAAVGREVPRRHDFSRVVVPHTNDLDVDLAAVHGLIHKRALARRDQDFRAADNLLKRLLTRHGVLINDTDHTWQTGTKKEVKKRRQQLAALAPAAASVGNGGGGKHDYALAPDAGPHASALSEADVHALLSDRRRAQRARDFAEADALRQRLKRAGVYVEDRDREWRADGVPFPPRTAPPPASLVQSGRSLPFRHEDEAVAARALLAQRTRCRADGRYEQADALRDRLLEMYDVRIDDRRGEWSVGGDFGAAHEAHRAAGEGEARAGYKKSAASAALPSDQEEEYVQGQVDARMWAKRARDYAASDAIRDELFRRFDVTIHDKINEWSAGGDFGEHSWTHVDRSVGKKRADGEQGEVGQRSVSSKVNPDSRGQDECRAVSPK